MDNVPKLEMAQSDYFDVNTQQDITVDKFAKICRTCLSQNDIKPIFDLSYDDLAVQDLLSMCASIQAQSYDCLPQHICSVCLAEVVRCYIFKKKCQQSEIFLRGIYDKELSDIKCKSESSLRSVRNHEVTVDPKILTSIDCESNDNSEMIKYDENNTNAQDQCKYPAEYCDNEDDDSGSDCSDIKTTQFTRKKVKMKPKRRIMRTRRQIRQGPPFLCRDCDQSFDARDELKEHRKGVKHPEARNHTCNICNKKFTSSKLRQHMRVHTKEKPFVCKVCGQAFSMSGNLKRHNMTHTGERPHVCEVCGKGFIQATTLQIHRKTHECNRRTTDNTDDNNFGPNFSCNYCGRCFKRQGRYDMHIKRHCSEYLEKSLKVEDVREYVCEICKRAYKTKHLLKAHRLTHGEKSFLCSDCGKAFVTKAALQSHLKVHTGEKPHTCAVCKKSFAHIGSFEAHMLIHTGQKPYNCKVCAKAFTQLSHLKYHLRTHSGERPYICSYCGKTFALKGNLTVHVRIHTGETPYLCPVCGRGFYDSSSMKKHRRGHGNITISIDNIPERSMLQGINSIQE